MYGDLLRSFSLFNKTCVNVYLYIDQSNSSVEKAGLLGSMPMRMLKADISGRMTGAILAEAIAEDVAKGLIPCYVVATLGTTGTCAFDCLEELGPICNKNDIWLHVDAAYAGTQAAAALPTTTINCCTIYIIRKMYRTLKTIFNII